jgi:hypothetical protein
MKSGFPPTPSSDPRLPHTLIGVTDRSGELPARSAPTAAHASPALWWVCDAEPWSRVRATTDPIPEDSPPQLPDDDRPLSYDTHIKPLFRQRDRDSMRFAFDLWSHQDVSTHAEAILARLQAGTMPCDDASPPERIAAFQRWVTAGAPA